MAVTGDATELCADQALIYAHLIRLGITVLGTPFNQIASGHDHEFTRVRTIFQFS